MQREQTFPGRFESLGKISLFVKQAALEAGLDENQTYAVELAVDEAASNIIEHAYRGEDIGEIRCCCIPTATGLTVILKDRGRPFDPDAVPEVNTALDLKDRTPGGAGVFLMRKVMDVVLYEFHPDGNTLTLIKHK